MVTWSDGQFASRPLIHVRRKRKLAVVPQFEIKNRRQQRQQREEAPLLPLLPPVPSNEYGKLRHHQTRRSEWKETENRSNRRKIPEVTVPRSPLCQPILPIDH